MANGNSTALGSHKCALDADVTVSWSVATHECDIPFDAVNADCNNGWRGEPLPSVDAQFVTRKFFMHVDDRVRKRQAHMDWVFASMLAVHMDVYIEEMPDGSIAMMQQVFSLN